ncbi:MAG: D-alanyl-D-alanine carboxypeptidase family protein [Lachnospiraceae bacterium]|jgi:D-alanyl-D-alanine carboxypeptidase (penicillin-binding protein 5/6)
MKRLFFSFCICVSMLAAVTLRPITVFAKEEGPGSLYSLSAVLMDGDSGRILYEKNGQEVRAMASTTKIMTCIIALEKGNLQDVVSASSYAASRPKVKLGMQEGETFYLNDLLYSLMLESHNDSAAAIAEHVGGSIEEFAAMMNEKAAQLGLENTYFITPNGLDASQEVEITQEDGTVQTVTKTHATTATELARILKYCIKESPQKDAFLEITRTPSYQFSDTEGTRSFSCSNHNAFLQMMEGALTGKTGFTANAGYCYVGALESEGRTFIVALLGCGWPNNKSYKWSDIRKLMEYGMANFHYRDVWEEQENWALPVNDGVQEQAMASVQAEEHTLSLLLHDGEQVTVKKEIQKTLQAPVQKGTQIGTVSYFQNDLLLVQYPVVIQQSVEKKDFPWYFQNVKREFLCMRCW